MSNFFIGILENLRHQNFILKLSDLFLCYGQLRAQDNFFVKPKRSLLDFCHLTIFIDIHIITNLFKETETALQNATLYLTFFHIFRSKILILEMLKLRLLHDVDSFDNESKSLPEYRRLILMTILFFFTFSGPKPLIWKS